MQSDCILWQGSLDVNGYGLLRLRTNGRQHNRAAHRVEWEKHFGPIPAGAVVMHKCDNPPCYNIEHLRIGTQLDNIRDCIAKGRKRPAFGEAVGLAKLTDAKVAEIRWLYAIGDRSKRRLAKEFKVSWPAVHRAILRVTWKHVV